MPQVSRWKLKSEIWDQIFNILLQAIKRTNKKDKAELFLNFLLTPTEQKMVAKRLTAALMLMKGATYDEIHLAIHLSPSTIAKVKNNLETYPEYKKIISKLLDDELFKKDFLKFAKRLGKLLSIGKGGIFWYELSEYSRKKLKNKII
jgi:uncharacterized protein YerC